MHGSRRRTLEILARLLRDAKALREQHWLAVELAYGRGQDLALHGKSHFKPPLELFLLWRAAIVRLGGAVTHAGDTANPPYFIAPQCAQKYRKRVWGWSPLPSVKATPRESASS